MHRGLRFLTICLVIAALNIIPTPQEAGSAAAAPRPRPNILVILTDDQRASGTLGAMPTTRRLFGRGGTEFKRAFATTPVCCPSRASILTGQLAHNHSVLTNGSGGSLNLSTVVYRYLSRHGYRTGLFGKFLNLWKLSRNPPFLDRWSIYSGKEPYRHARWNINGRLRSVKRYATNYIGRKATKFIGSSEKKDSRPWFMYLAPPAPHIPSIPHPKYRNIEFPPWSGNPAVFETNRSDKPGYVRKKSFGFDSARRLRTKQLRTLKSVDELVRGVFRKLRRRKEDRRTLAFFVSDNGYSWGEHGLQGKYSPYSPSVRIPMLMRWPGRVTKGFEDPRLAANIDITPTILDAARVAAKHTVDGRSLLNRWNRKELLLEQWKTSDVVPEWASIRTRSFQYVQYYRPDGSRGFKEFYRLKKDPWQLRNLLGPGDHNSPSRSRLRRLSARLRRARHCAGSRCP